MTLCIWMENIGDQESLFCLWPQTGCSPLGCFWHLLPIRLSFWDMIWLTTSDTRFSFYCIWDTNVHLLRTSHTFWVMYARWMAASWFSWLFLCRPLRPKIDDGGHFALIYHGWFSLSWTFEWSWSCQTKIVLQNKNVFHSVWKNPCWLVYHYNFLMQFRIWLTFCRLFTPFCYSTGRSSTFWILPKILGTPCIFWKEG